MLLPATGVEGRLYGRGLCRSEEVTPAALAHLLCLASTIYGRPAWNDAKCAEHAAWITEAAARHAVDPLLMAAIEIHECDQDDRDRPIYAVVRGRKKVVGYDRCPMGVRVRGVAESRRLGPRELYERAAALLGRLADKHGNRRGHHVSGYNPGNPTYAAQVLSIRRGLVGRSPRAADADKLTPRTREILRRLRRVTEPTS
jgi:hypothetical protein